MNKKLKGLFIFFIFLSGVFLVSSSLNEKNKISDEVYSAFKNQNNVRVIISLNEPIQEKGFLIKSAKSEVQINTEKEDIKERVIQEVREENVKHIFDDSIAVEISESELNELNNNLNVKSVIIDKPIHAFLQESVPLINATSVWPIQISGTNITGTDETICIIDTGIDFTHPALIGKNKTCVIDCMNGCITNCSLGDDNGHGTHVAGIAAASGAINGVAIGANLIGVKVLDSTGSGYGSDLEAGIEWCISNSTTYNISVISMSLGGGAFSDYCDNEASEISLASRINNATYYNISVIAATGNSGSPTTIASPACIKNVTAVGATTKADAIADYSNRNNLTDLIAPGTDINSTMTLNPGSDLVGNCGIGNRYCSLSGTSMATPHVAGAFALSRQFFRLQNGRVPTPNEIKSIFNSTGKQIHDSETGLNYSRIDVYSALISIDISNPVVSLLSPINNTVQFTQNVSFSCSANDVQLSNITLYIWNSTGVYNNTEISVVSGTNGNLQKNISNINYGDYKWNCLAYDKNNNFSFASSNFTFIIGQITTTLKYPLNNSFVNQNQTYNCSAETEPTRLLSNMTFYVWNSTNDLIYNLTNNISGTSNSSVFNYNFTTENTYHWNCLAYNNLSESDWADSNYTITYDITNPIISSVSAGSITTSSATITWNTNETTNSSINYGTSITSLSNSSSNSSLATNHSFSLTSLSSSTTYYYNITSCDAANNCNTTGTNSFTTLAPTPVSSSGNSGGGGSSITTATYVATPEQASAGYNQSLKINDKIKFSFFDTKSEEHVLTITQLGTSFVEILIQSEPIILSLGIGQSAKLNLTSAVYYDLYIKLNSIKNNKADIIIQTIHEEIPKPSLITGNAVEENKEQEDKNLGENIEDLEFKITKLQRILYIIVGIFIMVIIFLLFREKKYIKETIRLKKREEWIKEHRKKFKQIKPKKQI